MDVDNISFYPLLLDILTDISEAHFVAFDLELSGVVTKGLNNGSGKPSLQERYRETKEAAERYQILQFGLTCVTQDVVSQKYILKPYNFDLSPIIAERGLDIERIFSFQSGAVEFLLKTGFDMSRPFKHGVPYLSRTESREARDKHAKRQDKSAMADIQIKPTETESLAFLERARSEINAWITSPNAYSIDYVNIAPAGTEITKDDQVPEELSRFEKRLVHQLVRAEYPGLVSIGRRGFIQVVRFDKEREDKIAADRKRDQYERINRQKGFRWVIEALLGNDVTNIDLRECARDPVTGEQIFADMEEFRAQFHRAHTLMRDNPRVIVGHNCFLDLVYIYRTFIGTLPDTVEEFQRKLHDLWPVIADTKYMSTHNCGDINPVSSLEQIAEQMSGEKKPVLETAPEHKKYEEIEAYHEAGYDSFLTAQIAARLSSKLEREGAYVELPEVATDTSANSNGLKPKLTDWAIAANNTTNGTNGSTENGVPDLSDIKLADDTPTKPATTTSDEGFTPSIPGAAWKRRGDPTVPATSGAGDPFTYDPKNLKHRYKPEDAGVVSDGMPRFSSDFWRVYGNKLRVFGTEEGVCVLDAGEREGVEGDGDEVAPGQGGVQV